MRASDFRDPGPVRPSAGMSHGDRRGNASAVPQSDLSGEGRHAAWAGRQWLDGVARPNGISNPAAFRTDASAFGPSGRDERAGGSRMGPRFDLAVAPGGYAWWYVDALSDDGQHALTIIAFVGSVFSPYYAWARRLSRDGTAPAINHCAMNVGLYGPRSHHWAMTERGRTRVNRSANAFQVGPSSLQWDDDALIIRFDEITAPWPSRIRGTVRVRPRALYNRAYRLDENGLHRWIPIAPNARVEVEIDRPGQRWVGEGYLDSNQGDAPLEEDFARWDWSRMRLPDGRTAVVYDVTRRNAPPMMLSLDFDSKGVVRSYEGHSRSDLPNTAWGLRRATRCDTGHRARLVKSLEDGPFYSRALLHARAQGWDVPAVHESLSLDRFGRLVVQAMLPFKMPRW